jgi:hypothetical protein
MRLKVVLTCQSFQMVVIHILSTIKIGTNKLKRPFIKVLQVLSLYQFCGCIRANIYGNRTNESLV